MPRLASVRSTVSAEGCETWGLKLENTFISTSRFGLGSNAASRSEAQQYPPTRRGPGAACIRCGPKSHRQSCPRLCPMPACECLPKSHGGKLQEGEHIACGICRFGQAKIKEGIFCQVNGSGRTVSNVGEKDANGCWETRGSCGRE